MANNELHIRNAEQFIDGLVRRITEDGGNNPVVFLDTGAIIDFEKEAKIWKLKDKSPMAHFYTSLFDKSFPFFVTKKVWKEVRDHAKHNQIAGRDEISKDTFAFVSLMYENYHNFLQQAIIGNDLKIDDARYDVYWASKLAFDKDDKKSFIDPMSRVDRSLVAAAVWTKYAHLANGSYYLYSKIDRPENVSSIRPITSSIIISPDRHVNKTVDVLTGNSRPEEFPYSKDINFDYEGIRVVNNREQQNG